MSIKEHCNVPPSRRRTRRCRPSRGLHWRESSVATERVLVRGVVAAPARGGEPCAARHVPRRDAIVLSLVATYSERPRKLKGSGAACLRGLLDASPDAAIVLDCEGVILMANQHAAGLYGYATPEELSGLSGRELSDPAYHEQLAGAMRHMLEHGAIRKMQYSLRKKDGALAHAELSAAPVQDDRGECIAFLTIVRDMTQLEQTERALHDLQQRLRTALSHAPVLLFAFDRHGMVIMAEGKYYQQAGIDSEALLGQSVFAIYREHEQAMEYCRRALAGETCETLISAVDITYQCHFTPVYEHGKISGVICVATDITERLRAEEALRQSEQYLSTIFELAPIGMAVADMEGRFVKTNEALQGMLQYSAEEMNGLHWSKTAHPEDVAEEDHLDDQLVAGEIDKYTIESRSIRKDGETIWTRQTVSEVREADGAAVFGIAMMEDITERKAMEDALIHQTLHDALTGLPNRVLFRDRVDQAVHLARRQTRSFALLLLDLDRFKDLNDTCGHHYGDLLLQQLGNRLSGLLRPSDTVARLGGDEFAVVLPGADEAGAVFVATKIRQALATPFQLDDQPFRIDASIGIALYPHQGQDITALLRHADVAMYLAKRGSTGHQVYAVEQDQYSPARFQLTNDLRQALDRTGLLLHYQPKIDVRTRGVSGVEALVRWRHPTRGLLQPEEFIPLSEHTGLIKPLTNWVMSEIVRQQHAWRDAGLHLDIAVNLSATSFQDWDLVETLTRLLPASATAGPALTLEITEGAVMTDPLRAMKILTRLHELGVRIALDDFGTGYASLTHLKRLPLDEVKIDRSLVMDMKEQEGNTYVIRSVVDLSHNLKRTVVAEGVEDRETLELLFGLGCDLAQGYFFSEPLPAAELERWVEQRGV